MARILAVDDYSVTQRVLQAQLRTAGHETVVADGATAAISLLANRTVDLVICDIDMPDVDGVELLKHLRADSNTKDLPVIMLTASNYDEDRTRASAAGATAFLTKPSSTQELLKAVDQCLKH